MNKLCPFCGDTELHRYILTEDREGTPCGIACSACGARGPWLYLKKSELDEDLPKRALKLWNTRPALPCPPPGSSSVVERISC